MTSGRSSVPTLSLFACAVLVLVFSSTVSAMVVGIDLGSMWFKVAHVRAGGFEVVLNDQSNRKTHTMVAFNQGERFYGGEAAILLGRNPSNVYAYPTQLLGRPCTHPAITNSKEWYPYPLVGIPERGVCGVAHDSNTTFSGEEVVGMILRHARELANKHIGSTVKDCVITVPPFLTQHERQAIVDAATLAGFNVLSLINDITAFALNYAMERSFDNNTQHIVFYDVGASSARASLVTFQSVADAKSKKNKTSPQMLTRAVTWDTEIGGRYIDRNLVNHFKKQIKKQSPAVNIDDVRLTHKLLKEAQKMKEVLSANQQAGISIEGLQGDYSFSVQVTRKEFEEINAEFFEKSIVLLDRLLQDAQMSKEEITGIEIVGGGTRVPKFQAALKEYFGREELDKHINGDEGAATGAAFYAAGLSTSFRVRDIKLRDITPFPINVQVNYTPAPAEEEAEDVIPSADAQAAEESDDSTDGTQAGLFRRYNRLNSKKTLTFYTLENFTLDLSYDQNAFKLPEGAQERIGTFSVGSIAALESYNVTGRPKVRVGFRLTNSGLISLEKAEAEITVLTYPPKKTKNETLVIPPVEEDAEATATADASGEGATNTEENSKSENESENSGGETQEQAAAADDDSKTDESDEAAQEKRDVSDGEQQQAAAAAEEDEEPQVVKKVRKVPLAISFAAEGVIPVSKQHRDAYEKNLAVLDRKEQARRELQREKNSVEAYIYETRDKIETEEAQECSTSDERDEVLAGLSAAEDWLLETEGEMDVQGYRAKLRDIRVKGDKIFFRVRERRDLPEAVSALLVTMNITRHVLANITEVLEVTEEERDKVLDRVDETAQWLKAKLEDQQALKPYEDPVLNSELVKRRRTELETQSKRLIMGKPKRKPPKVVDDKTNSTTATEAEDTKIPPADDTTGETTHEPEQQQEKTQQEAQEILKEVEEGL